MIESILITNISGSILFSKYYALSDAKDIAEWEQALYKHTNESWNDAKNQNHEVAVVGDKIIVFTSVDDVLVFAVGSDEDNELSLYPLVDQIIAFLKTLCKKGIVSEAEFKEQYASIAMGISDMVHSGYTDLGDLPTIEGLLSFKVEAKKLTK